MAKTIISGDDLMLFNEKGNSLAYATSHQLSLSGETVDVSSKDHGVYGATELQKVTWEITSENLYTEDSFDELFDKMVAREPIQVYFGSKKENDPDKTVADGDYEHWTGSKGYTGKAFITSLSANASNGEKATFSLTLTGTGKISKIQNIPVQE